MLRINFRCYAKLSNFGFNDNINKKPLNYHAINSLGSYCNLFDIKKYSHCFTKSFSHIYTSSGKKNSVTSSHLLKQLHSNLIISFNYTIDHPYSHILKNSSGPDFKSQKKSCLNGNVSIIKSSIELRF